MVEIKAFVAHSFSVGDKELIAIFVEHFHSLASSIPGFRWDRALEAEPVSVAGKVLTKIEDKNVFIGICARNEYAMSPKAVFRIPFLKLVRVNVADIQWKTSDWIIQEIGLAVGRGMKVIIFLEDGGKPGTARRHRIHSVLADHPHRSTSCFCWDAHAQGDIVISVAGAKSATSNKLKETEEPEKNLEPIRLGSGRAIWPAKILSVMMAP
jgi:hypothetical protein